MGVMEILALIVFCILGLLVAQGANVERRKRNGRRQKP